MKNGGALRGFYLFPILAFLVFIIMAAGCHSNCDSKYPDSKEYKKHHKAAMDAGKPKLKI